ncbi:unnamed protein product, partial [Urochloa humidicola]
GRIRPFGGRRAGLGHRQGRAEPEQTAAAPGRGAAALRHLRRRAPSSAGRAYLDIQEMPLDLRGTRQDLSAGGVWPRQIPDAALAPSCSQRQIPDALLPRQLFPMPPPVPRLPSPL